MVESSIGSPNPPVLLMNGWVSTNASITGLPCSSCTSPSNSIPFFTTLTADPSRKRSAGGEVPRSNTLLR
jgi:hypothetical protein